LLESDAAVATDVIHTFNSRERAAFALRAICEAASDSHSAARVWSSHVFNPRVRCRRRYTRDRLTTAEAGARASIETACSGACSFNQYVWNCSDVRQIGRPRRLNNTASCAIAQQRSHTVCSHRCDGFRSALASRASIDSDSRASCTGCAGKRALAAASGSCLEIVPGSGFTGGEAWLWCE